MGSEGSHLRQEDLPFQARQDKREERGWQTHTDGFHSK